MRLRLKHHVRGLRSWRLVAAAIEGGGSGVLLVHPSLGKPWAYELRRRGIPVDAVIYLQ